MFRGGETALALFEKKGGGKVAVLSNEQRTHCVPRRGKKSKRGRRPLSSIGREKCLLILTVRSPSVFGRAREGKGGGKKGLELIRKRGKKGEKEKGE